MKLSHPSIAHSHSNLAHWSEPLTASGAAQTCPTCLPSPYNQLTVKDDSRHDLPMQRGVRPSSRHSALGVGTSFDFSNGVLENQFQDSLNNPALQSGFSQLGVRFPGSNDRQDSTFSRKVRRRAADAHFPPFLRVSGTLRKEPPFLTTPTKQPNKSYGTYSQNEDRSH